MMIPLLRRRRAPTPAYPSGTGDRRSWAIPRPELLKYLQCYYRLSPHAKRPPPSDACAAPQGNSVVPGGDDGSATPKR